MYREYLSTLALVTCMAALVMLRDYRGVAATTLQPGDIAPTFELKDPMGDLHTLESQHGEYTLINFWASWCAPCKAEVPDLNRLHHHFSSPDIQVIGIALNSGTSEEILSAASHFGVEYPILMGDSLTSQAFHITSLPTSILVDPNGMVITSFYGPVDGGMVRRAIDRQHKKE